MPSPICSHGTNETSSPFGHSLSVPTHRYTDTYIHTHIHICFTIPIQYFLVLHRGVCIYAAFSANEDDTGYGSDVGVTVVTLAIWICVCVCVCLLLLPLSIDCACLYPVNQYRLQGLWVERKDTGYSNNFHSLLDLLLSFTVSYFRICAWIMVIAGRSDMGARNFVTF